MNTGNDGLKKVLVIAYGFPPIAHVGVYRTIRFCRYLPDNGWKPTVITIREANDIHSDHSLLKRLPEDVQIHRTYILDMWRAIRRYKTRQDERAGTAGGPGIQGGAIRRAKNLSLTIMLKIFSIPDHMVFWIPFAVIRGIRLMRRQDFDVIYTTSPPHSEHLAGLILARIFRKPWVADFRDPIVDNFNIGDLFRFELWIQGLLEKVIVNAADTVITVTRYHRDALSQRYPALSSKFQVIRNGFDPALFESIEPEGFEKFTILFAGTLYGTITPDFFIRALDRWLKGREPSTRGNVQALFYGMGCEKAGALAKELGLDDVVKTSGLIPQEEIFRKQKGADLLLLIIGNDIRSRGVITSKLFEYMALGRPILAIVPDGEALDILGDYGNFHHVPHDDYTAFTQALDTAYDAYLLKGRPVQVQQEDAGFDNSAFDARHQVRELIRIFDEAPLLRSASPGEPHRPAGMAR